MNVFPQSKSYIHLTTKFKRGPGCGFNVRGSPLFISPHEIVYVVGQHLIVEDVSSMKQIRFIVLPYPQPNLLALSLEEGHFVAMSFSIPAHCIVLMNLKDSSEKFETIPANDVIECMDFSCDGVDLAFVTAIGGGEHRVTIWNIEQKDVKKTEHIVSEFLGETYSETDDPVSSINVISANRFDPHSYVLAGKGLLRKINYSERHQSWEEIVLDIPPDVSLLSLAWIDYWTMIIGCHDGILRVADHERVKASYLAFQLQTLDTMVHEDPVQNDTYSMLYTGYIDEYKDVMKEHYTCKVDRQEILENSVLSVATYHQGFVYTCLPNHLIIMQKTSENKYLRVRTLSLEAVNANTIHDIVHVAVWARPQATSTFLVCTTLQGQSYLADISCESDEITLNLLGPNVHSGEITGLELSWIKNRVVSVSHDRQLLVWNLITGGIEYSRTYNVNITGATMDQTGFYFYVSLEDSVRFYMYRYNSLTEKRLFDLMQSSTIKFSSTGDYVAMVNQHNVMILDNVYFENIYILIGNEDTIKCLVWSYKDNYIASCAKNGSLWLWHLPSTERWKCFDAEGVHFEDIAMLRTRNVLCAVGNSPYIFTLDLLTFRTNRILAWSSFTAITCISISSTDTFLFVGGDEGNMVSLWNPFETEENHVRQLHPTHDVDISQIRISPGSEFIITGSRRGTLTYRTLSIDGPITPKIEKTEIPVQLVVKEDYLFFDTKQNMLKGILNSIQHELDYVVEKEKKQLSERLYQEKNESNQEVREKYGNMVKLVQISDEMKKFLETKKCQEARLKQYVETLRLKLSAEEVLLDLERAERDVDTDGYFESLKEESENNYDNKKESIITEYQTITNTITEFITKLEHTLEIVNIRRPKTEQEITNTYQEIERVQELFTRQYKNLACKNEELRVFIQTEPYLAKQKNDTWDQIHQLTKTLQHMYTVVQLDVQKQRELLPQYEYVLAQWKLISASLGAQAYMLEEPAWKYKKIVKIRGMKLRKLEGALPLRDRKIWEKTKEAETLELETIPKITRKVEVTFRDYHEFLKHQQEQLSNTEEMKLLEKKVEITMQNIHDALFATQDEQRKLILKTYQNSKSFPDSISLSMRNLAAEQNRRRKIAEKSLMFRRDNETKKLWRINGTEINEKLKITDEILKNTNTQPLDEKIVSEKDMLLQPPKKYESSEAWVAKMIAASARLRRNKIYRKRLENDHWYKTLVKEQAVVVKKKRHSREEPKVFKDLGNINVKRHKTNLSKEGVTVRNENRELQNAIEITRNRNEAYENRAGRFQPGNKSINTSLSLDSETNIRKRYAPCIQKLILEIQFLEKKLQSCKTVLGKYESKTETIGETS